MTKKWCLEVLQEAIAKHGKPEIINSDQGSQYTSSAWIHFLEQQEIKISMDGKGRAFMIDLLVQGMGEYHMEMSKQ